MASASVYFNESPIGHCLASVVFAMYDDNILYRLIIIIIKMIILYFIQIRHTDDFSSAGIPASVSVSKK